MPQTFVFSTYGARGDVFPYLAIARELQNRGHRALVATSESYRREIEKRGLEFRAIRPDAPSGDDAQKMMHPINGTEFLFRRLLLPALRDSIADLRAVAVGSDVLISHTTSLAGPIVAEMERNRGLKWASSAVSPLSLLQNDVALPALPRAVDFPILNRAVLELLRRQFGMHLKETQHIRAELGLSRGDNALWSDAHSPQLQLCLWDERFAPVSGMEARRAVGFCFLADETPLSPEIEDFLSEGEAPIAFVVASFSDEWHWQVESIAAAEMQGKRALFLGGAKFSRGESDLFAPFAPLAPILPRCAALVHQGGIGTLALGLRAGLPMLLCPHSHDQPDNARRAQKLGLARVLAPKNYRAANVAHEIGVLLRDEEITARLNQWRGLQNGSANAADELEQFAN
ncbi:MAG: glycosyltransferase [Armatimonadetes bacterium]|nr:glycosyltransferase [Armatimonadota bacterium]